MADLGTITLYDANTKRRLAGSLGAASAQQPAPRRAPAGTIAVWTSEDEVRHYDERGRMPAEAVAALKLSAGRPSRSGKASDVRVTVRITADERERWERAAGDASLGEWIRRRCNEATR